MSRIRWLTAIVVCAWAVSGAQATEPVWEALRAPGTVVVLDEALTVAAGGSEAERVTVAW